jgi:hypothetical protein
MKSSLWHGGALLMRLLAVAWTLMAVYSIHLFLAVPFAVWSRNMRTLPGGWNLLTHAITIGGAPIAAVLVWRRRDSGLMLLALVAGNALLFWCFLAVVIGTRYPPVLGAIALGALTTVTIAIQAVRRLASHA